jgi:chromosome segregation ATPase
MKLLYVLALTASLIHADDDCEHICNERNAELIKVKDEIWHNREDIIREKDEIWHHRETVIREKDDLWHSREAVIKEKDELWQRSEQLGHELHDVRVQLDDAKRTIEELQKSRERAQELETIIESQKADIEHHQKTAQENQKFMMDYKNQLASQRDRAAQLDSALKDATAKIFDLENRSLGQHISSGWRSVISLVTGNKGTGESEF